MVPEFAKFGINMILSFRMNRESINRIAAIIAIVCGVLLVVLLVLTAPDLRLQSIITWRFVMGWVMIAVGIFALRMKSR